MATGCHADWLARHHRHGRWFTSSVQDTRLSGGRRQVLSGDHRTGLGPGHERAAGPGFRLPGWEPETRASDTDPVRYSFDPNQGAAADLGDRGPQLIAVDRAGPRCLGGSADTPVKALARACCGGPFAQHRDRRYQCAPCRTSPTIRNSRPGQVVLSPDSHPVTAATTGVQRCRSPAAYPRPPS